MQVVKIGVSFKGTATLQPKYAKIIADEVLKDAGETVAEGAGETAATTAAETGGASEGLSAAAILDVAIPAALILVAVGTVAGVADAFVQRSQNIDMRVGINTARASLFAGLYAGLANGANAGTDELYKKGWEIGNQAYLSAVQQVYTKMKDNLPPPDDIAEAARDAAKKAAAKWNGANAIDLEIRWAFFRNWCEHNHGMLTFQGAAQDAVLSCFGIPNEPESGEHMQYWRARSK